MTLYENEMKGTERCTKLILKPLRGSIKILERSTMPFPQADCPSFIKALEE
jgi:hypothetical protein